MEEKGQNVFEITEKHKYRQPAAHY